MNNDTVTGDTILPEDVHRWQKLSDKITNLFAQGDLAETEDVFADLQEEIAKWLLVIAKSKLPVEDAYDVVSEVYINLYDHFRTGQPIMQIRAFLRRLIKCRIVDVLRKRKELPRDMESYVATAESTETDEVQAIFAESEFQMDCQTLRNTLLEVMPSPEKEILFLRHYYGCSVEETAKRLQLTPDKVKKRTQSAIELAAQIAKERGIEV